MSIKHFDFVRFLGKGAYGIVWLVKRKATGDYYAMKIVDVANKVKKNIEDFTLISPYNRIQ